MLNVLAFIFLLLAILFFIALIIGLVKPQLVVRWGTNKTRKRAAATYIIASFVSFVLFMVFILNATTPEEQTQVTQGVAEEKKLTPEEEAKSEKKAQEEADRKAQEEANRKAQEEAALKAKQEEERKAQEAAAAQKAEEERKAQEQAVAQAAAQQAAQQQVSTDVYYENCTAVRAAGAAPIHKGEPGYSSKLDRDGDGIACDR